MITVDVRGGHRAGGGRIHGGGHRTGGHGTGVGAEHEAGTKARAGDRTGGSTAPVHMRHACAQVPEAGGVRDPADGGNSRREDARAAVNGGDDVVIECYTCG